VSRSRIFRLGAGLAGVALFAQSLRMLGAERIVLGLGRVEWGFAAILLVSGAREAARTFAWMRTVEGPVPLRFLPAFGARLAGEALNTLLPMGMVVGEPAKASIVGTDIPFRTAASALAVEFAFYCGSLALLLAAGVSALVLSNRFDRAWLGLHLIRFGFIVAALLTVIVLTAIRRVSRRGAGRAAPGDREGRVAIAVRRAAGGFRRGREVVFGFALRHPERVRAIIACEAAYQILDVAEVYITLLLVSPLPPTLASALVLGTVSRAITMLFKIVPLRVGVDEAGSSLFAELLDLGAATGLTLALVRKLRLLAWSAVGLALLVRRPSLSGPAIAHS
jgi:Lysylphosphatidylglycerol synthase TM region